MIKFDFSTYMDSFLDKEIYNSLLDKKESIIEKFNTDNLAFWYNYNLDSETIRRMQIVSKEIKENCDVLLVVGIGGSFMGSFAMKQLFTTKYKKSKPEVIYIGNDLSASNLDEVFSYIKDKDVAVNIISKSGSTLEVKIVYDLVKKHMFSKYTHPELKLRMLVTTSPKSSYLRDEAEKYGYTIFDVPENIGGRYSIATVAHLLPMLVMDIDIENFIKGYQFGKTYLDEAYRYAVIRNMMFKAKKYVENFSVYEPRLYYYTEFLKQLFAESEGKEGKGILPISTVNTRDLHSLGQFLQQGNKIIFETVLKINTNKDIKYYDKTISEYNNVITDSVIKAHYEGEVPSLIIDIGELNEENIGQLSMFFMISAAFSAYLFEVNPFDQSGVEAYKNKIKNNL